MMDAADQLLKIVANESQGRLDKWLRERRHLAEGQETECRLASGAGGIFPNNRRSWAGGSMITPKS